MRHSEHRLRLEQPGKADLWPTKGAGHTGRVSHAQFVREYAPATPVGFTPEIRLHLAAEGVDLWQLSDGEYRSDSPPPFWAFAWAGGQALARYLLDHPRSVSDKRVLDLACGSGLVGVAAALAGARHVKAIDTDPLAVTATGLNGQANGVCIEPELGDATRAETDGFDLVLAGDAFYHQRLAEQITPVLRRAAAGGALVLVGDPERGYLPRHLFTAVARYDVPVRPELEDVPVKPTTIWQLNRPAKAAAQQSA